MTVEELTNKNEISNLIVYYMDEKIPIDSKFVVYLKDLCMEKEKKLILWLRLNQKVEKILWLNVLRLKHREL